MKIRITKFELDLIHRIVIKDNSYFTFKEINELEAQIYFSNIDKAFEFDELIKEKLVYQGYDEDYNLNPFGKMCENIIDKLYNMLE